jgi:aminoglycoside/choline kinase family phosphotransferase
MPFEKALVKKIQALLKKAGVAPLTEEAELAPMTEGGSDRSFYRIKAGAGSFVVMASSSSRYDMHSYIDVGTFLFQHGIGVPRIVASDEDEQVVLLEDLGDDSLYVLAGNAATQEEQSGYYRQVLAALAEMQAKTAGYLDASGYLRGRSFGYEAFRWETDYFTECFLKRLCGFTVENDEELDREFHLLAGTLAREPRYFMHRDFQSQNIYIKDGVVRIIDFQTATRGLLQYDAVSLLKDAYVVLADRQREELLGFYLDLLTGVWGLDLDRDAFARVFSLAGLQRNMQALGAFAYLSMDKGKTSFAAHIPAALSYLAAALRHMPEFPLLTGLVDNAREKNNTGRVRN